MDVEVEKWNRLLAWMEELSDGTWSRRDLEVEFRQVPGAGRALFAKADIPAGSTILTMPRATLLHPRNIERVDNEAREAGTPNPLTIHASILPHSSPLRRDKHQLQGQQSRLTTTQTLSLYLALNRHSSPERGNSRYSPWADYIATLPNSFRPWHPLTWLVRPIPGVPGDEDWSSLNDLAKNHLPDSTYDKLQDMLGRYRGDLKTMERCVNLAIEKEGEGSFGWRWSDLSEEDLLWGWLNVNTRTLYLDLDIPPLPKTAPAASSIPGKRERSDADSEQQNHTMGPLIDLANHNHFRLHVSEEENVPAPRPPLCDVLVVEETRGGNYTTVQRNNSKLKNRGPSNWRKRTLQLRAPESAGLRKGDEVVFAYGPHSDETLFSEYGFVPVDDPNPWNDVHVDVQVNVAWSQREGRKIVDLKNQALELNGYHNEYTLHDEPSPAHPSHRLLTALRLIHAQIPASALQRYIDAPYDKQKQPDLQAWLDMLTGFTDRISDENEDAVYADLRIPSRDKLSLMRSV
ncbi:hypothetical protein NCC49_001716 [Naganishia albida]|nr:hypothetical protein NCC49_001716 [Naganishia albida]